MSVRATSSRSHRATGSTDRRRTPSRSVVRGAAGLSVVAAMTTGLVAEGAAAAPQPDPGTVEAEQLAVASGGEEVFADAAASGRSGLLMYENATATATLASPGTTNRLRLVVRGDQCVGAPAMTVRIDGVQVLATTVPSPAWTAVTVPGSWSAGSHQVAVSFTNDTQVPGCDRNLRVDRISVSAATTAAAPTPTPSTPASGNPLDGATLWVDPDNHARREIASRPGDTVAVAALSKLADQPAAQWFGDWISTADVAGSVAAVTGAAAAVGQVPVLVLYAIPHRDCGSFSAGGLPNASEYGAWVRQVAAGLGDRRAVVVLEPDALVMTNCLSAADQADRSAMLRDALTVLGTPPGAITYLDAGNSHWIPADVMAGRLRDAGVASARGFALNVSSFDWTADETAYGNDLSARLGGKPYVVDTSRNGNGPANGTLAWCNPAGRALGVRPTTATGQPAADAFLWLKTSGESDGECNRGEPRAGQWWADYAIGLAERAGW